MKQVMERTLLAAGCLLGAIAVTKSCSDLLGTELEGGTVTGPMLYAALISKVLFIVTLILAILWPRMAIVSGVTASLFCLPLYVYRTLPALFRVIFPGLYKSPPPGTFIWHGWSLIGMLTTVVVVWLSSHICFRGNSPTTGNA